MDERVWMNMTGLNLIEHIWDELEPGLLVHHQCVTLHMRFRKNGQKIPINTLLNLVDSIPSRIGAIIAGKLT